MRLSIGSGRDTARLKAAGNWVTLDTDPAAKADIIATLPPLPDEVMDAQWDAIEMIHVIEHFYLRDAQKVLAGCHEALKPSGVLILEAPDIRQACLYFLGLKETDTARQKDADFYDMFAFYGHQNDKPEYQHLWGYTPESLTNELRIAGFKRIEQKPVRNHWPWRDFRIEAIK